MYEILLRKFIFDKMTQEQSRPVLLSAPPPASTTKFFDCKICNVKGMEYSEENVQSHFGSSSHRHMKVLMKFLLKKKLVKFFNRCSTTIIYGLASKLCSTSRTSTHFWTLRALFFANCVKKCAKMARNCWNISTRLRICSCWYRKKCSTMCRCCSIVMYVENFRWYLRIRSIYAINLHIFSCVTFQFVVMNFIWNTISLMTIKQ